MKQPFYSNIIDLSALYSYVSQHPGCYVPPRSLEAKRDLRGYADCCRNVTQAVPEERGVYLWGRYSARGLWENIYLGFAGFGKTACLRARINEELRDEKCCIWVSVLGEEKILSILDGNRLARARALRKMGVTHIIWVATPRLANDEVHDVESDLIEALNPSANRARPAPPNHLQASSGRIFQTLRREVHHHRPIGHK